VVNVGGEQEIMIGDLGRMMMTAAALEGEIKLHPSPAGSVKRRTPALDKLRELTNYRADVDLTEGLRRTADFYLNSAG
jgi:nucleoside-diphosphate-sugar epimerase